MEKIVKGAISKSSNNKITEISPKRLNVIAFKEGRDRETNAHRLVNRQKQIDFGYNTIGYDVYSKTVPKLKSDPTTPDKNQKCSKRSWDGQIKKWRRLLHAFDPIQTGNSDAIEKEEFDIDAEYENILTNDQLNFNSYNPKNVIWE